jgi:hypothetical protein
VTGLWKPSGHVTMGWSKGLPIQTGGDITNRNCLLLCMSSMTTPCMSLS